MATVEPGTQPSKYSCSALKDEQAKVTDGELLEQFVLRHDEAAFSALLDRHGPMVLGVCRRMLRNEADAEDAFQSTFLVLVRKAATIQPSYMVGNWLYGVAHSTALKAKAMSIRRTTKEHEAAQQPKMQIAANTWDRLQIVLDQELRALPDKYRSAIVLCDLEGKPLKEAARELGCPIGTVGTRVARGRALLSRRLTRHGFTLSASALALLLSQHAAMAAVPPTLARSTTRAAFAFLSGSATGGVVSAKVAALALAVMNSMVFQRIQVGLAVGLVVLFLALGGVALAQQLQGNESANNRKLTASATPLQGAWTLVSIQHAGRLVPAEKLKEFADWSFDGGKFRVVSGRKSVGTFEINTAELPHEINLTSPLLSKDSVPRTCYGIYKLENDQLTICLPGPSEDSLLRPTEFASKMGTHWTSLYVLQRVVSQKNTCCP